MLHKHCLFLFDRCTPITSEPKEEVLIMTNKVKGMQLTLERLHKSFGNKTVLKGKLKQWYLDIFLPPFLYAIPIVLISTFLKPSGLSRVTTFLWVGFTALLIFSIIVVMNRKIILLEKSFEDEKG
jgi:hypothetical protein